LGKVGDGNFQGSLEGFFIKGFDDISPGFHFFCPFQGFPVGIRSEEQKRKLVIFIDKLGELDAVGLPVQIDIRITASGEDVRSS
jgi:hypothetical protein